MPAAFGRSGRRAAGVALSVLLAAGAACAEEWHEAYRALL